MFAPLYLIQIWHDVIIDWHGSKFKDYLWHLCQHFVAVETYIATAAVTSTILPMMKPSIFAVNLTLWQMPAFAIISHRETGQHYFKMKGVLCGYGVTDFDHYAAIPQPKIKFNVISFRSLKYRAASPKTFFMLVERSL